MGEIVNTENRRESHYLQIADDTSFDQWVEMGVKLVQTTQNIMWWLGDWWNFGERKYGEAASQAISMEIPYSTFSKASYVARKVDVDRRVPELSWSIHCEVAQLDPDDQDLFLAKARDNGHTVARVREDVKRHKVKELVDPDDSTNGVMLSENINFKASNVWTFGKPLQSYGVIDDQKTPPQLIANLLYFFENHSDDPLVVDLTDKYQVTNDVAKVFGYKVHSYDLYPHAQAKKVKSIDLVTEKFPEFVSSADYVFLNILDYLDNSADIDPEMFLRHQVVNAGTVMKPGSQLFLIAKDLENWKLENTFSLVYDENDFDVVEFISIPNKDTYTKDDELKAIANKTLLNKFGYVLVLEKR